MPEPIISIQDFMLLLASLSFPPQINKDISKEKVTPHLFFFLVLACVSPIHEQVPTHFQPIVPIFYIS